MVVINFDSSCNSKKEYEKRCITQFAQFFLPRHFSDMNKLYIDCPDCRENTGKQPDFFLFQPKIVVELKRVVDEKGRGNLASSIRNTDRLREEVLSRDLSWLRDRYLVRVPSGLKLRDRNVPKVVGKILSAIKSGQPTVDMDTLIDISGRQQVVIRKSSYQKGLPIVFHLSTECILPLPIIRESIGRVIEDADKQLGNFEGEADRRVVLLADDYFLSNLPAYTGAARNLYDRILGSCENVDEVWLQLWDPSWEHYLFFSRHCTREEMEQTWREMESKYLSEITSGENDGKDERRG